MKPVKVYLLRNGKTEQWFNGNYYTTRPIVVKSKSRVTAIIRNLWKKGGKDDILKNLEVIEFELINGKVCTALNYLIEKNDITSSDVLEKFL